MFRTSLFALLLTVCMISAANADVILSEGFDYSDGSLSANAAWTDHSGTALQMQVLGGQVVINEDGSQSEDVTTTFTGAAGTLYYGFDFSVADLGTPYVGTDNEYFAHFRQDGTFNFAARVDIVAAGGAGDFSVGIASDDSVADATWGTDLTYGTTYRLVVGYNQDTNQAQMWIDAALESDTSILGDDQADPGDTVDAFSLRQSNSDGDEVITFDNLSVATTFEDAATFSAVPEPSSIAILGLMGLVGLISRRRS